MNYKQIQSRITSVIRQYGQNCKIIHQNGMTSSAYSVFGTDITSDDRNLVSIQSKIIYVSKTSHMIQPGDKIIISKKEYYIDSVENYNQNDVNLAYKLGVID